MKMQISPRTMWAIVAVAVLALSPLAVVAQDSTVAKTTPAASTPASASASPTAPQLSYGVPEVLKLSDAKINEDTIIAYIQNSRQGYGGINAAEIVYLHERAVSDRVVAAMLNQRKLSAETAAQTTTQPATVASATTPTANSVANTGQSSQAYVDPQVTYVQSAPASTVYVIPNSASYVDYGYYPSYAYYGYGDPYYGYGYSYPAVSFAFGFGGGYRWGGHYGGGYRGGGYRGGFHGGGGYHGGSGHHR